MTATGTSATDRPEGASVADASGPTRAQRTLAQGRFALFLVLWVSAVAMWLRSGLTVPPVPFMTGPLPMVAALTASFLCASVGLAIALRRHEVWTGRLLASSNWRPGNRPISWSCSRRSSS